MHNRNNGSTTEGRNPDGTFATGNAGRPKGARHKTTLAVQELLDGEAEALTRKAIDLALGGDMAALRLCVERIAPARKDVPVTFDLPEIETAQDAVEAARSVLRAVAQGALTPLEADGVMKLVEGYRRAAETADLEARIEALEASR
jgi:hypothetical protein